MANEFWILAAVAILSCAILLGIDYSNSVKDNATKSALITGYVVLVAALLFATWGINAINTVIIKGAAIIAGAYFGRYWIKKIANRKV